MNNDKCREKEIFFGIYYAFFAIHILLFKQISYLCTILMDFQFEKQKQMKTIKALFILIISLYSVASCSKSDSEGNARDAYNVSGSIFQDSASAGAELRLFVDKHGSFEEVTLPVLKGKFAYKGSTLGTDELFLVDDKGNVVSFFAKAGSQIDLTIDSLGQVVFGGADSLNMMYSQLVAQFEECDDSQRGDFLDSVCSTYRTSIVPALLIRDRMQLLNDSVRLRQCLGRITDEGKPQWLVNSLEQRFDNGGKKMKRTLRLNPLPKFGTDNDTVFVNFTETRQNSMYIYFWADYSQESVDSLKMLVPMAKYYGLHKYLDEYVKKEKKRRPKRVDIMTVCLHAADSAAWKKAIDKLPGYHVLLQSGFSDPTMKSWKITTVPYNIITDRFSNIQDSYLWGKDLRDALEKTPSNFSVKLNGSKNSVSRTARH